MPLTRLANSIIDGVADNPDEVRADIVKYLGSDLLFYRADGPEGLTERQAQAWDPIVRWAADTLGARFIMVEGVVFAAQPEAGDCSGGARRSRQCLAAGRRPFDHDVDRFGLARACARPWRRQCGGRLDRRACR